MTGLPAIAVITSPPAGPTWTPSEAALHAKVSRRTVYNWIALGKVRAWKTPGGGLRVDPAELLQRAAEKD